MIAPFDGTAGIRGGRVSIVCHWEHGYRNHGLWNNVTGRRLAYIGLPHPRHMPGTERPYNASIDGTCVELGGFKTLRQAKRAVEKHLGVTPIRKVAK